MIYRVVPVLWLVLLCSAGRSYTRNTQTSCTYDKPTVEWWNAFIMSVYKNVPKTCYTDNQDEGVCVKPLNCDLEVTKIDPTTDFVLREAFPCHYLEMCCPVDKFRDAPTPQPREVGCGFSNQGASVLETGSRSGYADYGEFPWMVALLKPGAAKWADEDYIGGGTLIHPSVVMTVAHKVDTLNPSEVKCRAGEWDTQTEQEAFQHQEREVNKIILHEQFFRLQLHNDIALLILKEPFDIEPHINVACLSLTLPAPGTECYSMGWGQDLNKGYRYANILKKLTLPLVRFDECERMYQRRLGPQYVQHRSLICAGGEARVDTCLGDGGSSLICPVGNPYDQRYAVVGLVSHGLECGTENLPGVYTNVPEIYDWVGRKMTIEGLNRSTYVY